MSAEDQASRGQITTTCCIAGGGPAGMMLGVLLARAGIDVVVLEKHADFLRDFRGDTIHPSTMEMLDRIGAAEDLHRLRHGKLRAMRFVTPQRTGRLVELGRLKTRFPYIMIAPQARFLEFLHERARRYAHFSLVFDASVQELIEEDGVVAGIVRRRRRGGWRFAPISSSGPTGVADVRELAGL
jgi:2-polyprenyl-6-methoxyphenol hydroxylase-like FAD-dependent oxidoreductase